MILPNRRSTAIRLFGSTAVLLCALFIALPSGQGVQTQTPRPTPQLTAPGITPERADQQLQQQARTDETFKTAMAGVLKMEKVIYKSRVGGMDIPAFVFQPLQTRGPKAHAALVWVHPDIRGHVYEYYIPYIKDAIAKGYIVIAPEYRGSIGYGQAHFDAIDYGGAEVDDVISSVEYLKTNVPQVDPARIGIIGWSHGGMITLLSITREPTMFKAAAALVPVSNLFQRLAYKGVERQHLAIDPANRYGGLPGDNAAINAVYRDRSPVYQIDKLQIPLLVHITRNDRDVNIEECMQLVDALIARKPQLSETKVYENPKGEHLFDRQVNGQTLVPENTPEQVDSWNRVWALFDRTLQPGKSGS